MLQQQIINSRTARQHAGYTNRIQHPSQCGEREATAFLSAILRTKGQKPPWGREWWNPSSHWSLCMVSGPENLKEGLHGLWEEHKMTQWTGILDFRPSAPVSMGGRETTGSNLSCKMITVSTYRKQTWIVTGRQVGHYHSFCTNDGGLGRERKIKWKNVARPERHAF